MTSAIGMRRAAPLGGRRTLDGRRRSVVDLVGVAFGRSLRRGGGRAGGAAARRSRHGRDIRVRGRGGLHRRRQRHRGPDGGQADSRPLVDEVEQGAHEFVSRPQCIGVGSPGQRDTRPAAGDPCEPGGECRLHGRRVSEDPLDIAGRDRPEADPRAA